MAAKNLESKVEVLEDRAKTLLKLIYKENL